MTSLRRIKERIHGVKSTRQITSSMKVVALARLKRLHQNFVRTEAYSIEITRMVRRLLRSVSQKQEELNSKTLENISLIPEVISGRKEESVFLVGIVTSDDGLSGISNLQVVEKSCELIQYLEEQGKKIHIVCLGEKGAEILKRLFPDKSVLTFSRKSHDNNSLYTDAEVITACLLEEFHKKRYDTCLLVHNQFKSILIQKPTISQLIPNKLFSENNPWEFLIKSKTPDYVKKDILGQEKITVTDSNFLKAIGGAKVLSPTLNVNQSLISEGIRDPWLYDYSPLDEEILLEILPQYLTACVYRILIETDVSDNAARVMAMDNSTRNADQMLETLRKVYAKTRQNIITTDLVERVGALSSFEDKV